MMQLKESIPKTIQNKDDDHNRRKLYGSLTNVPELLMANCFQKIQHSRNRCKNTTSTNE